jgi:predicted CXXCH cytochrome family protein
MAVSRAAVVLLAALGIVVGCATPEERYRTLSFFFDDVPLPESMRPPPVVEEATALENATPAQSKAPAIEWVVHKPECKECHKSKETQYPYASTPQLCWDCHKKEDFANRYLHGPFAAGACLQCHTPHKSQYAKLLLSPVHELCDSCHDAMTFPEAERHRAEEGEDCASCHNPHSASERKMLRPKAPTVQVPASGIENEIRSGP